MNHSSPAYNRHIMNKMLWMSRNLRNCNDITSICNWAHTMAILKNLLLPPLPPTSLNMPRPSPTRVNNSEPVISITPPHTICFKPTMKKPLTQSPQCCTINTYQKPSPLTTYTLCLPNIASTDFIPQRPKRRKLSIPPSVDYNASAETPIPTSTAAAASTTRTTPGLGSHLWYKRDPKTSRAIWTNVKTSGAVEFKVVKTPSDFDAEYKLLNTTTGKDFYMMFPQDVATSLFKS